MPEDVRTVRLLEWYDRERRILPWREDPRPYHVWISEIMLQQTRVDTVIGYYERFLKELPDVRSLAEADEDKLLKLWQGLGYYSRVRNMKKAAGQIMTEHDGVIPKDPATLRKLAGIGEYTAAAIASIAYQVKIPSVDGNLLRVFARQTAYEESIRLPAAKKAAVAYYEALLPDDRPGDMNQALMDLGATICIGNGTPDCARCPLSETCMAHAAGRETDLPVQDEKKAREITRITVLIIQTHDPADPDGVLRTAVRKRPQGGLLAGLYEFPNLDGRLSRDEAARYLTGLGFGVDAVTNLGPAKHIFTHREWHMTGYLLRVRECPADRGGFEFVRPEDLAARYSVPTAFKAYMPHAL